MSITAKELAEKLHLSATAVSMALNNKPGVSTETRNLVIRTAEKYGYDFSKITYKKSRTGTIYCVVYHTHNAILNYTPIFSELTEGIEQECRSNGFLLKIIQIYEKNGDVEKYIEDIRISDCSGIILLGTEMNINICRMFLKLSIPVVLLDTFFDNLNCSSVLINNVQGAYIATNYLIDRCSKQPGHLYSSYNIANFQERRKGFEQAVREHGMSINKCISHQLSPSIEGAFADMLEIIDSKAELAECYFADNDLIAIGAMKALRIRGYRIPEDIAIIGFDNISEAKIVEPALTTIDIPRRFMGQTAARQLICQFQNPCPYHIKTAVYTSLVKRFSV